LFRQVLFRSSAEGSSLTRLETPAIRSQFGDAAARSNPSGSINRDASTPGEVGENRTVKSIVGDYQSTIGKYLSPDKNPLMNLEAGIDSLKRNLQHTNWQQQTQEAFVELANLARRSSDDFAEMHQILDDSKSTVVVVNEREVLNHLTQSVEHLRGVVVMPSNRQALSPAKQGVEQDLGRKQKGINQAWQEIEQALAASEIVEEGPKREALRILAGVLTVPISRVQRQIGPSSEQK